MLDHFDHEKLIDELSRAAQPVRRVRPLWARTLAYTGLALLAGYLVSRFFLPPPAHWSAPRLLLMMLNSSLALVLGFLCLSWALSLSIPGANWGYKRWVLVALGAWLVVTLPHVQAATGGGSLLGNYCFRFVLLSGLPMLAVVFHALHHSRCLRPTRALAVAGGAVVFLSFALLALCHPLELSLTDFAMHLAAAALLMAFTILLGRPLVAG